MREVDWVPLADVPALTGLTKRTVTRRVQQGTLPVVIHPIDRRRRLVRTADIEHLKESTARRSAA